MNKRVYFIFLITIAFFSCKKKCEAIVDFHENGKDKIVLLYPDCNNKTTFKKITYYDNGQTSSKGFIKSGLKNGEFKKWSKDGVLLATWQMEKDKQVGLTECWYENGIKKSETFFINGIRNGNYKAWNKDGKLLLKGIFNDNERNGRWEIYSENGHQKIDYYKNGELNGKTYEYIVKKNDTSYIAGQYKNGKENGLWKWFNEDSILVETINYEKGKQNGEHIMYFNNGKIRIRGFLVDDKYDGKLNMYDSLGNKIKKMTFDNGKLLDEKKYR